MKYYLINKVIKLFFENFHGTNKGLCGGVYYMR